MKEGALDEVGRYFHLNPVRIRGLGLSKKDQQRAGVIGCPDPGGELVTRRVTQLRDYAWSSWRMYAGLELAGSWLCRDRLQGGRGGRSLKEQRRSLRECTEVSAPVRKPAESAGLEFPIDTVFRTARRLAEPWTTKCLPAALVAHVDDPEEHPKEGRMACA